MYHFTFTTFLLLVKLKISNFINLRFFMKKLLVFSFLFLFSFFSFAIASEKVINVFLVGCGNVGGELLTQIHHNFSTDPSIEVRVIGLANSRTMIIEPKGISLDDWKTQLAKSKETTSIQHFISRMVNLGLPNTVFVDCTPSQMIADTYQRVLQSKISVVTPNKKGNAGTFANYFELKKLSAQNHPKFLYDSNVGAGLPFIQTIQSLNRSGDSIVKLEAILSGTLSYLFNTFDGTVPFSQVLRDAQQKGFTEPDPRDDLNGLDMARKFLILAREAGLSLEMSDIEIQLFVPDDCFEADSVSEFYKKLATFDEQLTLIAKNAKQNGQVLRFIGTMENGKAVLSLKTVGSDHPFYHLSDTDNIALISSKIYCKNPIVIKGPGAGGSITAANVLSNIIETWY